MKINILSPGRFHVCDLARELHTQEFDVQFYSFVSVKRAERFGLPRECSRSLFWAIAPLAYLERKDYKHRIFWGNLRRWLQDTLTSRMMRKADVTIAMSGEFCKSMKKAKQQGSVVICERGSKHIIDQKLILDANPTIKNTQITEENVKRELESYDLADYVAVASSHVMKSFLNRGFSFEKMFINPYGVDLSSFHPIEKADRKYDFLMVGNWTFQKGCDLIVEAIRKTNYSLLHVGALGDVSFPENDEQFRHVDPVDQLELNKYYNQCKVFVLPSRQDGLAMVLAQAMACRLPIIASADGGACDLQMRVKEPNYIAIVEDYNIETIATRMTEMLSLVNKNGFVDYVGDALIQLTWKAYGERYAAFLSTLKK